MSVLTIKEYAKMDDSTWVHGLVMICIVVFCGLSGLLCYTWAAVLADLNAKRTTGRFRWEKYHSWKLSSLKQEMESQNRTDTFFLKVTRTGKWTEGGYRLSEVEIWQEDRVKLKAINSIGWTKNLIKFDYMIFALGLCFLFDLCSMCVRKVTNFYLKPSNNGKLTYLEASSSNRKHILKL